MSREKEKENLTKRKERMKKQKKESPNRVNRNPLIELTGIDL